jgi:hypothetical protein
MEEIVAVVRRRRSWHSPSILVLAGALAFAGGPPGSPATVVAGEARPPAHADTLGSALVEWAYDRWTVPWVQVQGPYGILTARSYATIQVLACAHADLERERLVRHLSAEECEHRMAAFRADQDTSLVFSLHLATFDVPGARELLQLDPSVRLALEDDTGRRWAQVSVKRGAMVPTEVDLRLRRTYDPPWVRNGRGEISHGFEVRSGKQANLVEHLVRFARRDPVTGDRVLGRDLRWLRLRISRGSNEWVATWVFRTPNGEDSP